MPNKIRGARYKGGKWACMPDLGFALQKSVKNKADEADLIEDADLKSRSTLLKNECGARKACEHYNF